MIPHGLLLPTEQCPSLLDVKRALVTFEKIHIVPKHDRDVIPPLWFLAATTGFSPVGISFGPVRPLARTVNFENDFDQLVDQLLPAIRSGAVEIDTPATEDKFQARGQTIIGFPPLPPTMADPRLVYGAYRSLVSDGDIARLAFPDVDAKLFSLGDKDSNAAPSSRDDMNTSVFINGISAGLVHPPSATAFAEIADPHIRDHVARVVKGRIGSLVRTLAACEMRKLVPVCSDRPLNLVLRRIDEVTSQKLLLCPEHRATVWKACANS